MVAYHDKEWGVPLHNDRRLFEYLVLDANQAGLSWRTILHKRENFRKALHGFNPIHIAKYTAKDRVRLMHDAGIIRNRQKINASIENAKQFLKIQKEFGSFDKFIWQFVGHKPIVHRYKIDSDIGTRSKESDAMSLELRQRGFKFVGSTICYAFMQGAGMVNDHVVGCWRYRQ